MLRLKLRVLSGHQKYIKVTSQFLFKHITSYFVFVESQKNKNLKKDQTIETCIKEDYTYHKPEPQENTVSPRILNVKVKQHNREKFSVDKICELKIDDSYIAPVAYCNISYR